MADMFNQVGYQMQSNTPLQTPQTQSYVQPQQQIMPNTPFQNTQTYQNEAMNPYGRYQQAWQMPVQQNQQMQSSQDDVREYILLDGSAPNKKRKYVFVGEVDMQTNAINPLPSFSLEDIRKIVSHEFDVRFGEEKKS